MSAPIQLDLLRQMISQLSGAGSGSQPIVPGQAQAESLQPMSQAMALFSLLNPPQAAPQPELPRDAKSARKSGDVAAADNKKNLIAQNVWFFGKMPMAERVLNLRRMEPDIISSETAHLKPDVR